MALTASWRTPLECALDSPAKRSSRSCSTPSGAESDPRHQTADKTVALVHLADHFVDLMIEQTKIAGVSGNQMPRQFTDDPIEET